ncbi:hypothetical protein [Streptomyces sp. SP2-10]|uniref:hypothetical protein n=1 Tax=Streptomyces sp. SP2-10 TaxID=2873385 RepID=UPI001CA6E364|nr:hypothetical protein [Streptomyces sp. SP2-10]MBY8845580.1 hypothetical protein [Streptomyces sp. SP2-10]
MSTPAQPLRAPLPVSSGNRGPTRHRVAAGHIRCTASTLLHPELARAARWDRNNGNGAIWQLRGTSNGLSTSNTSLFGPKEYDVPSGSGIGETLLG